jgi:hypothetical protein
MYRIATIVNENEVSHSRYADTLGTLRAAMRTCNLDGKRGNAYHFVAFDKFSVQRLFVAGDDHLLTFDGLFIATNALSRHERVYETLFQNQPLIATFLDSNRGIFVSSQKKLSNGSLQTCDPQSVSFLPDVYHYYLFDRPEKYSSDGDIDVSSGGRILTYPYTIDSALLAKHCDHNQFMPHRYRSIAIPKHMHSYDTVLADRGSPAVTYEELGAFKIDRKVLLSATYNKRVVISTMALDWANHSELLANILTFLTEDRHRTLFVTKPDAYSHDAVLDSYILRANIANIPYHVISPSEMDSRITPECNAYIFSPAWQPHEVEELYTATLRSHTSYFSMYHVCDIGSSSRATHKVSKYCNYSSVDLMKDAVVATLLASFVSTHWNKSVWTYSYIAKLLALYDYDIEPVATRVYDELRLHFTKTDGLTQKQELVGSYDNVFNATCMQLEVLRWLRSRYRESIDRRSPYDVNSVINEAEDWLLAAIETESIFDQDVCYCLLYLIRFGQYDRLNVEFKDTLARLFTNLLSSVLEEMQSVRFTERSSVDLCRIYQTICTLWPHKVVSAHKAELYIGRLEETLEARQNEFGSWKNISETAEVCGMLLDSYADRLTMARPMTTIDAIVGRGIELLYSQFDAQKQMWSDDLGASAKAMYAIVAYDRRFAFAVNDFLYELKSRNEVRGDMGERAEIRRSGTFYRALDILERRADVLAKSGAKSEQVLAATNHRLKARGRTLLWSWAVILSLMFTNLLVVGILQIEYPVIVSALIGDWKAALLTGFLGFVFSVILTALYARVERRLME